MEEDDKGCSMIRRGVSGECFFQYRPTRVVPDQRPLNGCSCCYCTDCLFQDASSFNESCCNDCEVTMV